MAAISFVGSVSSSGGGSTGFQILKPPGVANGDLMLAILSFYGSQGEPQRTVTAPPGWTKVGDRYAIGNNYPNQICVMSRTAGTSEPSSWSGTVSDSIINWVVIAGAYRNAAGIVDSGVSSRGAASSYSTATVTNPASVNWRVTMGSYTSASTSYTIASNEATNRRIAQRSDSSSLQDVQTGLWDSNAGAGTGDTSRTISRGAIWNSSCSWIGILEANDATIPGTFEATMPLPLVVGQMNLEYEGDLDVTMPLPSMTAAGIATPPEGPLDVTVTPVVGVAAVHEASGVLNVLVTPSMGVVGETRRFGIRVVTPASELRVITPQFGAVD